MQRPRPAGRWRLSAPAVPLALLLLLGGANALAIAGLVSARRSAREAAVQDLQLQTEAHARALEAVLASERRALVVLTRDEALHRLLVEGDGTTSPAGDAHVTADRAMAGFLESHPAVVAAALRANSGSPLVLVARREGGVAVLPAASDPPAPIADRELVVTQLPVGGKPRERGLLEAWIERRALLEMAAPTLGGRLELLPADEPSRRREGRLVVAASVRDPLWSPPIAWTLVRDEPEGHVLESVAELATRYRGTAMLNIAVMVLTLLLGLLAFQQAQRSSALAAENRNQARLRELERQILHAERLASVGRLAAGVAHEVNNPLEGAFNYLALADNDLAAGDVAGARSALDRTREGLGRVAAVMRQMLSLSDPGRVEKRRLDLRDPLERSAEFLRAHAALREVVVRLDMPPAAVWVDGNAVTLGQLFLNLLLNAGQSQGGRGAVSVGCETRDGRAVVRVADHGPGFAAEVLPRAFEPFFSTRGSIGLGLAVCAEIAADHGGAIRAANRPDGGAEVVVELPLARTEGGR